VEELLLLLKVHRVSDVRQILMHTCQPLVPNPTCFEVYIAITKLKRYKLSGSDQSPAEVIQAGGETIQSDIQKHVNCFLNKEELSDHW
jgi:hypothetical protein